jgi:hypothetical protein
VVRAASRTRKPVTAFLLQTPAIESSFVAAGIPLLGSPERAVAALA